MIIKNIKNAVIFDDHLIFAESFSILLERMRVFQSIHTFNDEGALMDFIIKNHQNPILFFLDYYIGDNNSLHLINEIKRINKHFQIVIISSVTNPVFINNILKHNVSGIISKVSGTNNVLDCIEVVQGDGRYICPHTQSLLDVSIINQSVLFSSREMEVLQYFALGYSISKTAEIMFLSKHTIVAHRRKMMSKIGCNSISELLAYARKMELI